MKVKEVTVTVGTTIAGRSQFEPDKISLSATLETTTPEEADEAQLRHHCRHLTEELSKSVRKLTGVKLFAKRSKE